MRSVVVVVSLTVSLGSWTAFAQSTRDRTHPKPDYPEARVDWRVGPVVGSGYSDFAGDGADASFNGRWNLFVGARIMLPMTDRLTVQSTLGWMMRGADYREANTNLTYRLDYLELRASLRVLLASLENVDVSAFGTAFISVKLHDSVSGIRDGAPVMDMADHDYGPAAGVGVQLGPDRQITADLVFQRGLASLPRDLEVRLHSRSASLLLGYVF